MYAWNMSVSGNTIVTSGTAFGAGGVLDYTGARLVDCHIDDNVLITKSYAYSGGASVGGGSEEPAVWVNVTVERNLLLVNGSLYGGADGEGGGIQVWDPHTLEGCEIRGNRIVLGWTENDLSWVWFRGAGIFSRRLLTLVDCIVADNSITALPTVAANVDAGGAGMYQRNMQLTLKNSTLQGNVVTVGGSSDATSLAQGGGEWPPHTRYITYNTSLLPV